MKLSYVADRHRSIKKVPVLKSNLSATMKLARRWLRRAAREEIGHGFEMPTRLLEIKETARLRRGDEIPHNTKYATLSHCWGRKGVRFKLTKKNITELQISISLQSLPKTFQDAIIICRHLGIHYLWIDSLCIIQDDASDWAMESVKMGAVYGNSFVTIAASAARDGDEGCLHSRKQSSHRLFVKTRFWKKSQLVDHIVEVFSPDMVSDSISKCALARRGWVLQERLLSSRILYFTKSQLVFESNNKISCETFPNGIHYEAFEGGGFKDHMAQSFLSQHEQWARMVEHYTQCELTQRRDVLVAVSGIIRKIQKQRKDICLAGIWRDTSEGDLLWTRHSYPKVDLDLYTAPTWSWASRPGSIKADAATRTKDWWVKVLDINVCPVGNDPLGELRGGSISMACKSMIHAKSLPTRNRGYQLSVDIHIPIANLRSSMIPRWDNEDLVYDEFFLVKFYSPGSINTHSLDPPATRGLILVPTGTKRGQYTRVGHFQDEKAPRYTQSSYMAALHYIFQDSLNRAPEAAFTGFLDRGGEKWGVVEIK